MHIAPGKKKKSWDSDLYKSHLGRNFAAWLGGQSEMGSAASRKAVWWDLCLASVLMQLLTRCRMYLTAEQTAAVLTVIRCVRSRR